MSEERPRKEVLVTGANGYLGAAVADAFVRAGWKTYGLVRQRSLFPALHLAEVIPILGSSEEPKQVLSGLQMHTRVLDVIVGTTESIENYDVHHGNNVRLFRALATESNVHGVRPLLIFTSGCKDYGHSGLHGSDKLVEHTESSPLKPPPFAIPRAAATESVLKDHIDVLDVVSTRPTTMWGRSSSFYKVFFDLMAQAKSEEARDPGKGPILLCSQKTALHGTHVDDVGSAYVAIAEASREMVKGKVYNISGHRYETLDEIVQSLVREYDIKGKVEWLDDPQKAAAWPYLPVLGFSQWVGSNRLREDTGWSDKRALFSESVSIYRRAYEEANEAEHEGILKIQQKLGLDFGKAE